ncbi:hypothetical protein ACIFOC_02337 [Leucobacter aridicollis]|uniref:bifunctional glycosyltransferase/CDP-glycerol:glycerophosphate glycerophosphotransferase n=1 Tax=Leucobacter aridicollis TaxID=283878 RepID=UPI0037C84456
MQPVPTTLIDNRDPSKKPLFSVIVAVYNSQRTLRATLRSFELQTSPNGTVEYVFVNDGSIDKSLDIVLSWARARRNVVVLSKPNGGIASTRNAALAVARGEWVTSVDPDDIIERHYFDEVAKMIAADAEGEIAMLATRVLVTKHETGKFSTKHPLDKKFRSGNRLIDLRAEPNAFAIGATTFLRRLVLAEADLGYDSRIAPSFEDGNLILRYLSHFEVPLVAIVSSAHYFYRKVSGGNSAVQGGWSSPSKYIDQVQWGYLGALEYVRSNCGYTPDWLAVAICYDLMYYFKEYHKYDSKTRWVGSDTSLSDEFLGFCRDIFTQVSFEQLQMLNVNAPSWSLLQALRAFFFPNEASGRLFRWGARPDGKINFTVVHAHPGGDMQILENARPKAVRIEGSKTHSYFGRVFAEEVSFSLDSRDASLFIDGILCPADAKVVPEQAPFSPQLLAALREKSLVARRTAREWSKAQRIVERARIESAILQRPMLATLGAKVLKRVRRKLKKETDYNAELRSKVEAIRSSPYGQSLAGCWYLLDHPERADDNAEHLYRYLMNYRPEINAVFALQRDSNDWERLSNEGFHLVDYGSPESSAAALQAAVVLSSDAVEACMYPAPRKVFGKPQYDFVFLQHGICEKDISAWLRGKDIAMCLTSTSDEFSFFAWKKSPYEFQMAQVALTGLPRHDALLQKSEVDRFQVENRQGPHRLLLIPTWRKDLKEALAQSPSPVQASRVFRESVFGDSWLSVLEDPDLSQLMELGELRIDLLLHPNFDSGLEGIDLPLGVNFLSLGEKGFQEMIIDCDSFLTDFSSLAFDASYVGKAVSYFHFDIDLIGAGTHSWVPGNFDYDKMGLGPVHRTAEDVVTWIRQRVSGESRDDGMFRARAEATFLPRDGNNCARVVESVELMLSKAWPLARPALPAEALPPIVGIDGWIPPDFCSRQESSFSQQ